jgi:hypothetical protein
MLFHQLIIEATLPLFLASFLILKNMNGGLRDLHAPCVSACACVCVNTRNIGRLVFNALSVLPRTSSLL